MLVLALALDHFESEVERRACRLYKEQFGADAGQVSSAVYEDDGDVFVDLYNSARILARYKVHLQSDSREFSLQYLPFPEVIETAA